jgi:hypothetical protein
VVSADGAAPRGLAVAFAIFFTFFFPLFSKTYGPQFFFLQNYTSSAVGMPVVFIHCPYSNLHQPQMGRVWVENNYPLKKWRG